MPAAEGGAAADARARENDAGGDGSFRADLPAAVGDEPGDPDGAGTGEQLRRFGHGGLRGGGQDRFLRLHAPAGLWKRLFHLHRPESRGEEKGPDPGWDPLRGPDSGDLRPLRVGGGGRFRQMVPADLHPPGGNGIFERRVELNGAWSVAKGDRRKNDPPLEESNLWRRVSLPCDLQKNMPDWAGREGRFWYRKRFNWDHQNSRIYLKIASISGENRLWINGKLIGVTDSETDVNAVATVPRDYPVPPEALRKGSNEILICVDYETDAALGLNGSTGNILFPFEFHLFSGSKKNLLPPDLDLTGKEGWRIQKVSGPSEPWRMEKSVSVEIPCTVQARLPEWSGKSGWFRIVREIQIPAYPAEVSPTLLIGAVDDEDIVFINGKEIGRTTRKTNPSNYWCARRLYTISPALLKPGINRIEILLHDFNGSGGITAPVKLLFSSDEQKRQENLRNGYLHPVGRADDPYWHHGF